jgi:AcrR family transcriptional regulator
MTFVEGLAPFETQRERRRTQLVAVAARLLITSGTEGVTHAAVAQHAGITRPGVYKYFPVRDDLLAAVVLAYGEHLTGGPTQEEVTAAFRSLLRATPQRQPPAARALVEQVWALSDWTQERLEMRLGTVILARDPDFFTRIRQRHPLIADLPSQKLAKPLAEIGLTPVQVAVVTEAVLASEYRITSAAVAGSIDRDTAMELGYRMMYGAIRALLD